MTNTESGIEHEIHALEPVHVGDLVRVAHDRSGPSRHDGPGELGWCGQAGFNMHVCVDEAGHQKGALQIYNSSRVVALTEARDPWSEHGDVDVLDVTREYVDHPAVRKQEIGGLVPAGHCQEVGFLGGHGVEYRERASACHRTGILQIANLNCCTMQKPGIS